MVEVAVRQVDYGTSFRSKWFQEWALLFVQVSTMQSGHVVVVSSSWDYDMNLLIYHAHQIGVMGLHKICHGMMYSKRMACQDPVSSYALCITFSIHIELASQ